MPTVAKRPTAPGGRLALIGSQSTVTRFDELPRWTRVMLVVLLLAAADALLAGAHLLHGGLYTDDWAIASIQHQTGIWGLFESLSSANRERPLGELYLSLTAAWSGTDPHLHALWGMLTLLLAGCSVYLLLRLLSLCARDAAAIVLLFMAFPFADAAWLWYAANYSFLAIALAASGAALAVTGLRHRGRTAAFYHGGAMLLFACSVLTYQVAAGLICLSVLLYLPLTARCRAVTLWVLDVGAVVVAAALPRLITGSSGAIADPIIPFHEQVDHAKLMVDQGLTLMTAAIIPFRGPHRNVVLPIALLLALAGALLAWRSPPGSWSRSELRRWLLVATVGGIVVAAAYVVYVPAPINLYQPLGKGEENRVNVMASLGYVLIAYALAMMLATTLVRLLRRPPQLAAALGVVIAALLFVGYARRLRHDIASWDRGGTIQRRELAELHDSVHPGATSTIYTFGGVGAVAPGVYAFRETWDLNGAVQVLWNHSTLRAYPIFAGTQMICTSTQVVPDGPANGDSTQQAADYGQAIFYDFRDGREQVITGARTCAKAAAAFVAGPVEV